MKIISTYIQFQHNLLQVINLNFNRIIFSLKILGKFLIALLLVETGYILGLMPDWEQFIHGPIPKSRYIKQYEYQRTLHNEWPNLRWQPISLSNLPKHLLRAVIVAEDSRFYQHTGFDQEALKRAFEYNISQGKIVYGASTISQQTVKNLFLSPSRNPLRKLHEAILTYTMEINVGKQRILEIYLNNAEFGRGIFGVEAAARYYFGKSSAALDTSESIGLAATLPSPVENNPATQTTRFIRYENKIKHHLGL